MTPSDLPALFRALHRNIALSELAFVRASLSTPFVFRRRNNENSERDVLRHDAHLFGVEPLTNAHLLGACLSTMSGDGITRRSAKLAQRALALALASRGALSECRATPQTQIGTGFNLRTEGPAIAALCANRVAPNSSARAGFSVSTVRRSIMSVRDPNFFQEIKSKFRILGGRYSNRTRGRKARREGGGNQDNPRDEQHIRSVLEHDEQFERVFFVPRRDLGGGWGATKARSGKPLRACVYYVAFRRCQGRENFSGRCPRNFSAQFLDKSDV